VRPAWDERAKPQVADYDLKKFGATTPERPTIGNNALVEVQSNGVKLPGYVHYVIYANILRVYFIGLIAPTKCITEEGKNALMHRTPVQSCQPREKLCPM
jgi:hypothetical protein